MNAKQTLTLLKEAPIRPHFSNVNDAVAFADRYDVWFKKVKQATGE